MGVDGRAVESQGFESPYLQTSQPRLFGIKKTSLADRGALLIVLVTSASVSAEIRNSSRRILLHFSSPIRCGEINVGGRTGFLAR